MNLTARDRAVLAYLASRAPAEGAAPRDISRGTPGGNAHPTLLSLERRGLVELERANFRDGEHVARARLTADGLEAFILSGV